MSRDERTLSEWVAGSLQTDLTVLLDIDPSLAARQIGESGGKPDHLEPESLEFHKQVRQTFLNLAAAAPERYLVLDTQQSPATLHEAVRNRACSLPKTS